jgi:hypothetical protein
MYSFDDSKMFYNGLENFVSYFLASLKKQQKKSSENDKIAFLGSSLDETSVLLHTQIQSLDCWQF